MEIFVWSERIPVVGKEVNNMMRKEESPLFIKNSKEDYIKHVEFWERDLENSGSPVLRKRKIEIDCGTPIGLSHKIQAPEETKNVDKRDI